MGDGKIREVEEVGIQALAGCACESNCVCTQGVYMCGCVHNACVMGLCRWLLCVCMRVYIVQGWGHGESGSQCMRIRFAGCVHGCVLCFLYMSLHAALITGCSGLLSVCPLFPCVSAILIFAAMNLCKHMCMWPLCTCEFMDLNSW